MDFMLLDEDTSERTRVAMRGGLAWLDNECATRFGKDFVERDRRAAAQVLDDIAWPEKAQRRR